MEQVSDANVWKKCSSCKKPISFGQIHYVCSVSTCNGQRTGYVFCSVPCFETHLPGARHRDAAAVEARAPAKNRILVRPEGAGAVSSAAGVKIASSAAPVSSSEVLVIASRLKDYIQARSGMNTSASVMDELSNHLRSICDRAVENARAEGRKTVMDRDLGFLKHLK